MVIERVSRKTVVASSNETSWSLRLRSAFAGSHSNLSAIGGLYNMEQCWSRGITPELSCGRVKQKGRAKRAHSEDRPVGFNDRWSAGGTL
jgi:hypothetical protein